MVNQTNASIGGTTPNHMIARSEFEVHREMYKDQM